jgi:hypothetical protein
MSQGGKPALEPCRALSRRRRRRGCRSRSERGSWSKSGGAWSRSDRRRYGRRGRQRSEAGRNRALSCGRFHGRQFPLEGERRRRREVLRRVL